MVSFRSLVPVLFALLLLPAHAQHCNEDGSVQSTPAAQDPGADADPRAQLQSMVDQALAHSKQVGAAYLLKLAADEDLNEAKAQHQPTVSVGATWGPGSTIVNGITTSKGVLARGTVSASMPIWDAGRIDKLTEWRKELREAARYGQANAEEQIALQTVSLALDRSRYTLQVQVYGQFVRRMSCLVDALNIITKADKGRAGEQIQAQKSLQQAQLSLDLTVSTLRQVEVRLRHFVGDQLPPAAPMSSVLSQMPALADLEADVLLSADVAQATAAARAQRRYTESVVAGLKPSVSVVVSGDTSAIAARQTDWSGAVAVNIPILVPGSNATVSAALRRTQAADMQRDDAIESKRYRLREMYESATSTLDRVKSIVDILRNSERVRANTLQQWQELGRRSLFDVMSAEGDYYSMRIAHVNALFDTEQIVAMMWSQGRGVMVPLR
jgi:outer membrane protein TolC